MSQNAAKLKHYGTKTAALACGTGTRFGSSAVNGLLKTIASITDGICASGINSKTGKGNAAQFSRRISRVQK